MFKIQLLRRLRQDLGTRGQSELQSEFQVSLVYSLRLCLSLPSQKYQEKKGDNGSSQTSLCSRVYEEICWTFRFLDYSPEERTE